MKKKKPTKMARRKSHDQGNAAPELINLKHTKLERRRLLNAHFELIGSELILDNFEDSFPDQDNSLFIGEDANHYLFKLGDGVFSGDNDGDIISGNESTVLKVDKSTSGLVAIVLDSNTTDQFDILLNDFEFHGDFNITQSGPESFLSVSQASETSFINSGTVNLSGDTLHVQLDNMGNDFDTVDVHSAVEVSLRDTNSITIDGMVTTNGSKIVASDDIHIAGAITNNNLGSIGLHAGNDVEIAAVVANPNDITITAGGDVLLSDSGVVETSSSGAIEIAAVGSISDNSIGEDAQLVADTGMVRLDGGGGIGASTAAGDIDVQIGELQFETDGEIHLTDLGGGLEISDVSRADGGGTLTANSPLTISADVTVGATTVFTAGNSPTANDDLLINNNAIVSLIAGLNQTLSFNAGDDIVFDTGRIVTTGSDNAVVLTADTESNLDSDRGSITNEAGALISVDTNNLLLFAAAGIGDSSGDLGTTAGEALRIKTDTVSAVNSTSNGILLTEMDSVQIVSNGISNADNDAKLTVGADLAIDAKISLGTGDLFLDVAGDVTQTAPGIITAAGLGLMVDGTTALQNSANNVVAIASDNGGTILYADTDGLTVGNVTVEGMSVTGIKTDNSDVKLIVGDTPGEDLSIERSIKLGSGDLFLDVAGDVTQTLPGTIVVSGLGLLVDGDTRLQLDLDANTLAAMTGGTILLNDVDDLTVGTVTVLDGSADEMQLVGITTTNDDVKLIVGNAPGEDLSIERSIKLGSGDLFLDVAGDVTQTLPGTIVVSGLGLLVDGDTRLQLDLDANTLAAMTGGTILLNDVDDLTVGTVTVLDGSADEMQLVGITTTDTMSN